MEAQSISVKRAQVEFHNFASLGQPERVFAAYADENRRRKDLLHSFRDFIGPHTPFLEIGANAGHSSYMLANDFGADGFALDISADALRHGIVLQEQWQMPRAPVRLGGDALNLPFRDGSLRFVMTYQTLSQFLDLDAVMREVVRVLAPGGVFMFAEEPIRRMLTLRLFRSPYYDTMKPWERKLSDWGLLNFFVKDVIGAGQEESFGIRQNHTMGLKEWQRLLERHFVAQDYRIFATRRGAVEGLVRSIGRKIDRHGSDWVPARLLGGTLAAVCRKAGKAPEGSQPQMERFEELLRCPDCRQALTRDSSDTLRCTACSYEAPNEGGVYNLIRSSERQELYPGDREDLIDFSRPSHAERLREGWHQLEGVFGNRYRWIGAHASAHLVRVHPGPMKVRIRGHASDPSFTAGQPVEIEVKANGQPVGSFRLDRPGLFILEAPVPDAPDYTVEVDCSPVWHAPGDNRDLTVNLSLLRLVDA